MIEGSSDNVLLGALENINDGLLETDDGEEVLRVAMLLFRMRNETRIYDHVFPQLSTVLL